MENENNKNVLAILKQMVTDGQIAQDVAEKYFPELAESEDEKIRKELIEYHKTQAFLDGKPNNKHVKFVAWLEKQGESYTKRDIDDAYLKGVTNTKNEIEKQYEANYQIRKDIATFIFNYKGDIKDRAKWMNYLGIKVSFVEKQGEQKETLCDKCRREHPSHSCQDITELGRCALEKQGEQKPADETKLKIEGGKWYVCISQFCNCVEGRTYKATSDGRLMDDFGTEYDMHSDAYKYFRLWTIQDAKAGDVLYSQCCKLLWIYKDKKTCHVGSNLNYNSGSIVVNKPICIPTDVHPATKEQRDLLFQKMKEAGYEWDAEKKELKKIEQNSAWSEEDEKRIENILSVLDAQMCWDGATGKKMNPYQKEIDWLKSLRPCSHWKPSEEQMKVLNEVINFAADHGTMRWNDYIYNVLKSLREQLKKLKE